MFEVQGWARAPATDFHEMNKPKPIFDVSWNCNATAGLNSGFDSLLQSYDSQVYLSLPWRIDKPIFPPRIK